MSTTTSDAQPTAERPSAWLALTLLLVALVAGGVALVNVRLDLYGLFRDSRDRGLGIFDSERRGKYLLSRRYVPENFRGLLLGSSLTSNWNTAGIHGKRIYNESTDGGNITEERTLAEEVMRHGRMEVALLVVHPFLTDTHGMNTEEMTSREYFGALGSTSLLRSYLKRRSVERSHGEVPWDEYGTEVSTDDPSRPLNPTLTRIMAPGTEVVVDEAAFADYRALVRELRDSGTKVMMVIPPTREDILQPKRAQLQRYADRMRTLFAVDELVIDFNAPEFATFRNDRNNFTDGVHLSKQGAAAVVAVLNEVVR